MVFPVVMYLCESWSIKKAEHQRIDAFELWCWRRLLRVPWTARKSNQSILRKSTLNIHWKDWCWSWSSSTLATWYKELTHWKIPWCWERLKVGGEGDERGWDGWMASLTQQTWVWVNFGSWWWTGRPGVLHSMGSQRIGHDWVTKLNCVTAYWFFASPDTTHPFLPQGLSMYRACDPVLCKFFYCWFAGRNVILGKRHILGRKWICTCPAGPATMGQKVQ